MKRFTTFVCSAIAILFVGFGITPSANAQAGVQGHLNVLAAQIERKANRLLHEVEHYEHTPQYHRLVSEVIKLRGAATHVRKTTFCTRSFHKLEADLRTIDRCFHRVEGFFDRAEVSGITGHGRVRGNTAHVKVLLNSLEKTIDFMRDDVRDLKLELFRTQRVVVNRPQVYHRPVNVYQPPVYRPRPSCQPSRTVIYQPYGGSGISFGGDNFQFRIRF